MTANIWLNLLKKNFKEIQTNKLHMGVQTLEIPL